MIVIVNKLTREVYGVFPDTSKMSVSIDMINIEEKTFCDSEYHSVQTAPLDYENYRYLNGFITEVDYDLAVKKEELNNELFALHSEFANLISQIRLLNDSEPTELKAIISELRKMNDTAKSEIKNLDKSTMSKYVLNGELVKNAIITLKSML